MRVVIVSGGFDPIHSGHIEHFKEAKKLNDILMPFHKALFIETSPSPVKYVLSRMKLIDYELRLPLVQIRNETRELLDKLINDLELI